MIKINTSNNKDSLFTRELFSIPIYEIKFDKHQEFKQTVQAYLIDENSYERNTSRETLKFTHSNLHKEPTFKIFVDFLCENVSQVYSDLGYVPNFEITSLWATRHIEGGYHHRHVHNNSFISGVYYFNGVDNKTPGTIFHSDWKQPIIQPAVSQSKKHKIQYNHLTNFEEGKLIIFPSWLSHNTPLNVANSDRIILSFNTMPVGKTNTDPFDRYNYQSVQNVELINYNDEKFK